MESFHRVAVTGRKFRDLLALSSIPEPEAVEFAARYSVPPGLRCPAVVSAGGETFMVYVLGPDGRVTNVKTGNKCASGTGEFFLQQIRRLGVGLEEAAQWAADVEPHPVSGRCSVFCKSDCTHATNKGVPRQKVVAGLCRMMAGKVIELLNRVPRENILLTGGTTRNRMMVEYLKKELPGLVVPKEACAFEALGAALWALENQTLPYPGPKALFTLRKAAFATLPPLKEALPLVRFETLSREAPKAGDACLLGLDVGSTTTKAVLVRADDKAILGSVYLRTNGDPVGASRACYAALAKELNALVSPADITITALGVCGSGRQIAGLHARTECVVNEIIAHATAAARFDPGVDTIFEIGGQDAKYTYLTAGVASDYAMNEACSAGTGSFLEEAAFETLGVSTEDIADLALQGGAPPNFNDQCAAFISSDVKNAVHEGISREDILAGLVYSICMNYANRVKGNRPVGGKIFMQGGVCYNKAVPLAMAALTGKPIVVPPEPGLMGAYGVALVAAERMRAGLLEEGRFDLEALAAREVEYGKSFVCPGGKERCDRKCQIATVRVEGAPYAFGGACDRYANLRRKTRHDAGALNLVRARERLVYETHAGRIPEGARKRGVVALNRSFFTHALYPLYSTFFAELGYEARLPEEAARTGMDRVHAAFCYPVELAHGFFGALLDQTPRPDFVFLPHVRSIHVPHGYAQSQACPLAQGEPFYLSAAFAPELAALRRHGVRVLSPFLEFHNGMEEAEHAFLDVARELGARRWSARRAYQKALLAQERCVRDMRALGREALLRLAEEPEKTGVVLFGRPYNAFASEAHMGIPHKLATRGVLVIPHDFLDTPPENPKEHMYWGMGQTILRAAKLVSAHPQLHGTYVTNFSCGPDSFVIGYFRELMGKKPSLTLELDSHTADAGIETRIEAFLDVVAAYRQLEKEKKIARRVSLFVPAKARTLGKKRVVVGAPGRELALDDSRVTLLFPSMGPLSSGALAAVFRGAGFNAVAARPADEAILKLGRANTSCKECLPLLLTVGTLLDYTGRERRPGEHVAYFMPTADGPCRFGQYRVFMEDLLRRLEIPDVSVFSLSSRDSYESGLPANIQRPVWQGFVAADVFEDARSMLLAAAVSPDAALEVLGRAWARVEKALETLDQGRFLDALLHAAIEMRRIPLKRPAREVPVVTLAGEIFVRRDSLSRRNLVRELAKRGFAARVAPVSEWVAYTDYLVEKGYAETPAGPFKKMGQAFKRAVRDNLEARVRKTLAKSGLVPDHGEDIAQIMDKGAPWISPLLLGEAVLTAGSVLLSVGRSTCGAIAIGPFGCMPNRLAEAVLAEAMREERLPGSRAGMGDLPLFAIESDGSPFPQVIMAKLDAFCLRARRLDLAMREAGQGRGRHRVSGGWR
jgi:predicted CoA-substrate-specific enzyme activase